MLPEAPRLCAWNPLDWPVASDWHALVRDFVRSPAGARLGERLEGRLAAGATIYPPTPFLALEMTPLSQTKVVILGQDPYHGPGQAHGLAFSVADGVRPPPSLINILAEVHRCGAVGAAVALRQHRERSGNLQRWARQGVLLLNTCLTVEQGRAGAHAKFGWEALTDALVVAVAKASGPRVFMLWGAHAQAKTPLIKAAARREDCLILSSNHPSPLSARRAPSPFVGCAHFSIANDFLELHRATRVDWTV